MRQTICDCQVDALTMDQSLERIEAFIREGSPHQHVVVNVNKLIKASNDPALRDIINSCDLINCDGMPVVWASKLLGCPLPERVAGIDLFTTLVGQSASKGWKPYFLGAKQEIVSAVVEKFTRQYPDLQVAGWRNGYWKPEEEAGVVQDIRDSGAQLLFVAFGSPKKEQFLNKYLQEMQVPFVMGVGGSFDVVAGLVKRAPVWMQNAGLEWFYRFLQEPRRLFNRYFCEGLQFIWLLTRELACRGKRRGGEK